MPLKKYINGSWVDTSYKRYETGTDAVTTLPVEIFTDGQPVSSYTLKGNTSVSGTPSPQNPVTISGVGNKTANLFNINGTWTKQNPSDTVTVSGNSVTITSAYFAYMILNVESNTDYTLSYSSEGNYTLVRGYNSSTFSSANQVFSSNRSPVSFNTGNTETLYILFYSGTGTTGTTTYSNIMLSEGAAIPFEPYGQYKISILKDSQPLTPIYLSQPLMYLENGDDKDDLSSNGTATYKIAKYICTGAETWKILTSTSVHQFYTTNLNLSGVDTADSNPHASCLSNIAPNGVIASARAQYTLGVYLVSSGKEIGFQMKAYESTFPDIPTWQQYLADQYTAGTPIIVYYVLATPTTESVTVPSIPTTGGEVSIDVDTTVKPSELDLTYHGWHEHQPLKRENGAWV